MKGIFILQLKAFVLVFCCLSSSCSGVDTSESLPQNTVVENSNQPANQQPNEVKQNSANLTEDKTNQDDIFKSPYQRESRRKTINFPDDCAFYTVNEEFKLQRACAFAIDNVLADLPKGCDYDSFLSRDTTSSGIRFEYLIEYAKDFHSGAIQFYPLLPNKYLVEIRCWTAAYNLSNIYMLYDESKLPAKAEVLNFPDLEFSFNPDDKEGEYPISFKKVLVKSVSGRIFDSKTKQLIAMDKKTGIGYAGHYARYSFSNDKPTLLEYRAKFKEDGKGLEDNWQKNILKTWKRYYP